MGGITWYGNGDELIGSSGGHPKPRGVPYSADEGEEGIQHGGDGVALPADSGWTG